MKPIGQEIKKSMKTNTNELDAKELNMNELEQVTGGGACAAGEAFKNIVKWVLKLLG